MVGISEILQTLGAMIIFSLILLTANRMIQANTLREVESEAQGLAVTLAQDIIEEAQTKPFDENTRNNNIPENIPEGFSTTGSGGCGNDRSCFNDFDDYHGYTEDISTELTDPTVQSFHLAVEVFYIEPPNYDTPVSNFTRFKKMIVTVTSDYLSNNDQEIKLSYLRQYYKTKN